MTNYETPKYTCGLHKCVLVTSYKDPYDLMCWACSQIIRAAKGLAEAVEGCGHCDRGCGKCVIEALTDYREQSQLAGRASQT